MKRNVALGFATALVGCSALGPAVVPRPMPPVTSASVFASAPPPAPAPKPGCTGEDSAEVCKSACDGGHQPSCTRHALLLEPFDPVKAGAVLEKACKEGELMACSELGLLLEGDGLERDYPRAASLQKMACDGGIVAGCSRLAELHLRSEPGVEVTVDEDIAAAVKAIEDACDKGYMKGCARLGALALGGVGMPEDLAKARTLSDKACDAGLPYGCEWASKAWKDGPLSGTGLTTPQRGDKIRATEKRQREIGRALCASTARYCFLGVIPVGDLEKACSERGIVASCNDIGVAYEEGHGVEKHLPLAVSYFEKACAGGMGRSCYELGRLYRFGSGVPKDERRSFVYLERSCALGLAIGCDILGSNYLDGAGADRDVAESLVLRRRACGWHDAAACQVLGQWLVTHDGQEVLSGEGKREAFERFRQACNEGQRCLDIVFMRERGWGTPKDPAGARKLAQFMCDHGHMEGCAWLKNPFASTPKWVRERDAADVGPQK